jgi:RNA polymerase sigma factor (sigma-70 family)
MASFDFETLVSGNENYLRPFAFTLTRDNELAKDLVQETMFRALANHDKYNVGTNIKAWLYTIMRNIFINDYRKKAKHKTVLDGTDSEYLLNHQQSAVTNGATMSLQYKYLNEEVHKLPVIFKKPFLLYVEGFKYNEIADMLNEPLGTIKSRIFFARKLLKDVIAR